MLFQRNLWFYTLTKLQGSQTDFDAILQDIRVLHSYKITRFSNCVIWDMQVEYSFTLLQNYKVLKLYNLLPLLYPCFTLLQNYKVLKQNLKHVKEFEVLHSYKITRFSNDNLEQLVNEKVLHSYKITRFSNILQ